MGNAVIAVRFPEPEDDGEMAAIIDVLKKAFEDREDVKVMLAIKEAADTITFFCENGELPTDLEEGNLVRHARRELALIDNDEDFNLSIIEAVRAFSKYGHSGGSASVAIPLLFDLLQFKNITPLTDDPDEWQDRSEESGVPMWQSKRNPAAFSEDGGETYYLLDGEGNRGILSMTEKKEV